MIKLPEVGTMYRDGTDNNDLLVVLGIKDWGCELKLSDRDRYDATCYSFYWKKIMDINQNYLLQCKKI